MRRTYRTLPERPSRNEVSIRRVAVGGRFVPYARFWVLAGPGEWPERGVFTDLGALTGF
jgi:hypothetical protein